MKVITSLSDNTHISSDLIVKKVNNVAKPLDYFQYSTSEQFTGQYWIDGKKIYQRTWKIGAQGGGAVVYIQLENIDKIWYDMANSFYVEASSSGVGNVWPLNGNFGDANANGYQVSGRGPYYVPSSKRLHWQVSSGGCSQAYITIRYTKTTG